jgi:hypothetical protein
MTTQTTKSNKNSYEDFSEYKRFIIDGFAAYYSPREIHEALKEQFTDEEGNPRSVSLSTLRTYQIRHADVIKSRREELAMSDIPVLDPMVRFRWLQDIIEESMAGMDRVTKGGVVIKVKDFSSAIKALDTVNKMTNTYKEAAKPKDSDERAEKKRLVEDLREQLKKANPEALEVEINNAIISQLGSEAQEYLM